MKQYMVEVRFSRDMTPEFMSLIPAQQAHIHRLMQQNVLSSYVLSLERTKLWTIVNADTEEEAIAIIEAFPMYAYFKVDFFSLTFNNQAVAMPSISLN